MENHMYSDTLVRGMCSEIDKAHNAGAYIATITLIYVCIDSLSYLNMPLKQRIQNKSDFILWVNTYLKTDPNQEYQYQGIDIYAARCGQLHTYSPYSDFALKNKAKTIGYHDGCNHRYVPSIDPDLVIISIPRLKYDFFKAIESFFIAAQNDINIKNGIDSRITKLYQQFNIT